MKVDFLFKPLSFLAKACTRVKIFIAEILVIQTLNWNFRQDLIESFDSVRFLSKVIDINQLNLRLREYNKYQIQMSVLVTKIFLMKIVDFL